MTTEREELNALRRLAELEAKESGRMVSGPYVTDVERERRLFSPTVGMGGFERLTAGYGGAIPELFRGGKQRLTQSITDPLGLTPLVTQSEVSERMALDKPLLETGAGSAGRTLGLLAPAAATSVFPGANTIPGATGVGGLFGLLKPTIPGESTLGNALQSAAYSGIGAGVASGLPVVLKSLIDPFRAAGRETIVGNTLMRAAGRNAPEVIRRAGSAPELIPGSVPTLAEATQDAGMAGFQLAASSMSPDIKRELATRGSQNVLARTSALRGIAGDAGDLAMAKGVRGMMTEIPYKEATSTQIDTALSAAMKPQIESLMRRPAMRDAIDEASKIFAEGDVALLKAGDPRGLQFAKQALDDLIESAGKQTSSIGKNRLRALQQTRSDLISTMEELTPKLREADVAFREWSKPVNQMQVGQYLHNKMVPALMDFTEGVPTRLRADTYAQALRDAPTTIANATGRSTQTLEQMMSPGQMNTLTNVARDLSRKATADDLAASKGSVTAQNLAGENLIRQFLGPVGLPQSWAERVASSSVADPLRRGANLAFSGAEQHIQQVLGRALADPKYAAQLMQAARDGTIKDPVLLRGIMALQQGAAMAPAAIMGQQR